MQIDSIIKIQILNLIYKFYLVIVDRRTEKRNIIFDQQNLQNTNGIHHKLPHCKPHSISSFNM